MNKEEVLKTHSIATAKTNAGDGINIGDDGIVSTYQPKEEKFVVHFNKTFHVFCETEKSFLTKFDITEKYV